MKTNKANYKILLKAAEIAASDEDSFFRYGCNAIVKAVKKIECNFFDNYGAIMESRGELPEIEFLNNVFDSSGKMQKEDDTYGYWGECHNAQNQNARIIGLLLLVEILKDEQKVLSK